MDITIGVGEGDGVSSEIMPVGLDVLDTVGEIYGHNINYRRAPVGDNAYRQHDHPYPDETRAIFAGTGAVYMVAVGGTEKKKLPRELTPERGYLLPFRHEHDLFINRRPAKVIGSLSDASPLKGDIIKDVDIEVVRENTGGIYFGNHLVKNLILEIGGEEVTVPPGRFEIDGVQYASDLMFYSQPEIERITRYACELAMQRRGIVTSVDKANVLEVSALWREIVTRYVMDHYPHIELNHLYVDNAAIQLAIDPRQFDVILTSNLFGDILSDQSGGITGSLGLLPSGCMRGPGPNDIGFGLYEPVHGSAPLLVGKGTANPIAHILAGAMMLRHSFGLTEEADAIEGAVIRVLRDGYRTVEIAKKGDRVVGTHGMGDLICKYILRN
jgi:3-isopropylmalate dehydrogenase